MLLDYGITARGIVDVERKFLAREPIMLEDLTLRV
jgi:hypothetical protein